MKREQDHQNPTPIPHRGALSRIHLDIDNRDTSISYNQPTTYIYAINILSEFTSTSQDNDNDNTCQYQMQFHPDHYKFMQDLFIVLDTDSRGFITKQQLEDFVLLRCPVFKRRDCTIQEFESCTTSTDNEKNNGSANSIACDGNKNYEEKHDDRNDHDSDNNCWSSYEEEDVNDSNFTIENEEQSLHQPHDAVEAEEVEQSSDMGKHLISIEKQDKQEIFNCILGEDFHPTTDKNISGETTNGDQNLQCSNEWTQQTQEEGNFPSFEGDEEENTTLSKSENTETVPMRECVKSTRNVDKNERNIRSQTFEEIWDAVIRCSLNHEEVRADQPLSYFGIEAWMVFCRFISFAQYQDADRRFSARHLQKQIEPQKNLDSNEVILVDVPPLERPVPISTQNLIEYELLTLNSEVNTNIGNIGIALPELDLDHSHLLLHDGPKNKFKATQRVHVCIFGHNTNSENLEFIIRLTSDESCNNGTTETTSNNEISVVRRSYSDLSWLHNTFKSQKHVSGLLCGRIIPPFPSLLGYSQATDSNDDKSLSSNAAISVASESAEIVTSAAKSFLGQLSKSASKLKAVTKSSLKSSDKGALQRNKTNLTSISSRQQQGPSIRKKHIKLKEVILDNPISKATQLERYLNYMLSHPAMSTSFPLNVILRSSKAGVESASRILDKLKKDDNNNLGVVMHNQSKYSLERYGITSDISWVRSAAQAALALKLHGILETTGYQSTSTKLHHASLPKFSKVKGESDGIDEESTSQITEKIELNQIDDDDDFEKGIICIETCLDGESDYENSSRTGFDVLPLPIPLHKRSALCAGSSQVKDKSLNTNDQFNRDLDDGVGTNYGDCFSSNEQDSLIVGDVLVDRDINRLRDLMRTVDESLKRGFCAGLLIGAESSEKMSHQLSLLKEIDLGDSLCPRIIGQNALLTSVEALERSHNAVKDCIEKFINGFCWNSALASCAVAASDEVREAVKASQTARRAKLVAEEAAKNAENVCSYSSFSSADEKMQAITHASDLRSQAIYAAVVDHEALTAKRRAAVALARDVKCWNVHRKKELIKTCLKMVRSHRKTAFDTMSAWIRLQQSLLESQSVPNIVQSRNIKTTSHPLTSRPEQTKPNFQEPSIINNFIEELPNFSEIKSGSFMQSDPPSDVHSDFIEGSYYDNLDKTMFTQKESKIEENSNLSSPSNHFDIENGFHDTFQEKIPSETDFRRNDLIHEELQHHELNGASNVDSKSTENIDIDKSNTIKFDENDEQHINSKHDLEDTSSQDEGEKDEGDDNSTDNGMTDSMQSLVDGLMNWGGQWDEEEDIAPLPDGMAASLLEGSGMLKTQ